MDNDEKTKSRDDETLPTNDDEQPSPDDIHDEPSRSAASDEEAPKPGNTLVFPPLKPAPAPRRLEDSFGMPDLSFFAEPPASGPKKEAEPPVDELFAPPAEAGEEQAAEKALPLGEGTGWESVDSIAKPASLQSRIEEAGETPIGELFANEEEAPEKPAPAPRHDAANVTPFPGTVLHRLADPAPADLLRGGPSSADVFEEISTRADEDQSPPAAATAAITEAPANQDTLADAVQSALRNIYGGYSEPQEEQQADLGNYTVAEALAGSSEPAEEEGPAWSEDRSPADWRSARAQDYDAEPEASEEPETEGVLDYLYNQRRQERAAPQAAPEMSLSDYAARAAGLGENWQSEPEPEEDSPRVAQFPSRDRVEAARRAPDFDASPEPSLMRGGGGGGYYREEPVRAALEPEWTQTPYATPQNTRGQITPTYTPSVTTPSDQLPTQGPDSGHLLGAAGLGLIGGIALAGVLAVFVFNSFVDESGQAVSDAGTKVVERLATPPAASPATSDPQETRSTTPEPRAAEAQPAPPPPAPAQTAAAATSDFASPAPAPRETQPQRSAAREVAPPAPPAPPPAETDGKPRLLASAVTGAPDSPIKLNIALSSADVGDALVSLKGLPKEARLSTGIDVGGGQWLLPPARLRDLTVTAPVTVAGAYQLEAQLLKDDAQTSISDPVPFSLNIGAGGGRSAPGQQAPAVAPSQPKQDASRLALLPDEAPLPETDFLTQMLIRDGNKKMREGDIAAARRLYEQAAQSGNAEAALAMGRSYDPTYFERLNVKTGKPDPATAFEWYKKALDSGLVTAKVKIDTLKQWLQK